MIQNHVSQMYFFILERATGLTALFQQIPRDDPYSEVITMLFDLHIGPCYEGMTAIQFFLNLGHSNKRVCSVQNPTGKCNMLHSLQRYVCIPLLLSTTIEYVIFHYILRDDP